MQSLKTGTHFWQNYWGVLLNDEDSNGASIIYGFENQSTANQHKRQALISDQGACFGFVAQGEVNVSDEKVSWRLNLGQWFSLSSGCQLNLQYNSRIVVSQRIAYQGVYAMGGPIESCGRLRYIDGCSDTLLCAPPLMGDPCLNLLHFPPGINQTAHTHPSTRSGIVARGRGICQSGEQKTPLEPGLLFYIARETEHQFSTEDSILDVIAYHPDSDWGPTHEKHPMVNRTWVAGHKIDNSVEKHQSAEIIRGQRSL